MHPLPAGIIIVVLLSVALTGCAASTAGRTTRLPVASSTPAAPPATPQTAVTPTVDVVFVRSIPKERFVRFVALIHNPGARPVSGVRVRWDAVDESGALLGGRTTTVPPIAAGGTQVYVGGGGAALIGGAPASVRLAVEDSGAPGGEPPVPFAVDGPSLAGEGVLLDGERRYRAAATITIGDRPVTSADVIAFFVLRDAAGVIVGTDFSRLANVPATLAPGTRVRVSQGGIGVTAPPATVEVIALTWP